MDEEKQDIRNELTFIDSWKEKPVQLAAGGALVIGAGSLIAKGQGINLMQSAGKNFKHVNKNTDRYIMKNLKKPHQLLYRIGKNTVGGVAKSVKQVINQKNINYDMDYVKNEATRRLNTLNQKTIDQRAFTLLQKERTDFEKRQFDKLRKDQTFRSKDFQPKSKAYYEEKAKQELIEEMAPKENLTKKKMFGKDALQENITNIIGAGTSGAAFATGISVVHAFDKNPKAKKSYEVAGSFLQGEDDKEMNNFPYEKQAAVRDFHESVLKGPAGKVGGALLTGVGFGGSSLAFNELMKKKKAKDEADKKHNQSRIIIEFGEDDEIKTNPADGGMGLIPRPNLLKQANVNNFAKNLLGRKPELRTLNDKMKHHDYLSDATKQVAEEGIPANNPYAKVFPDKNNAADKYVDSLAKKLREKDRLAVEAIKDDVAKAQTYTAGGLGALGLAGVAANQLRKDEPK